MTLFLTILGAIILLLLAVGCLAIGWFLTGKMRLKKGCGMVPKDGKKERECRLCGSSKTCEQDEEKEK